MNLICWLIDRWILEDGSCPWIHLFCSNSSVQRWMKMKYNTLYHHTGVKFTYKWQLSLSQKTLQLMFIVIKTSHHLVGCWLTWTIQNWMTIVPATTFCTCVRSVNSSRSLSTSGRSPTRSAAGTKRTTTFLTWLSAHFSRLIFNKISESICQILIYWNVCLLR